MSDLKTLKPVVGCRPGSSTARARRQINQYRVQGYVFALLCDYLIT